MVGRGVFVVVMAGKEVAALPGVTAGSGARVGSVVSSTGSGWTVARSGTERGAEGAHPTTSEAITQQAHRPNRATTVQQ